MVMVGLCSHHIAMFDLAGGAMPYILPCFYSKTMAYRIWRCLLPHPRLHKDKSYHKDWRGGRDVHKYVDKEIHVTADGSLQKWLFVKR